MLNKEERKFIEENLGRMSLKEISSRLGIKQKRLKREIKNIEESRPREQKPDVAAPAAGVSSPGTPPRLPGKAVLVALLCVLVCAAYANTIPAEFVWDDQTIVVRNEAITSFKHIPYIFKNEFAEKTKYHGNTYRPLQELSYMIDYYFWKLNPKGFHLTNVLLQISCTVMLFFLVFIISRSTAVAFISAAILGIHPINTEAVAYVSGRNDPIYLIFLAASFILYIKSGDIGTLKRVGLYGASVLCYALSLLAREIAVVMPLVLVSYEKLLEAGGRVRWRKVLPYIAVLTGYGILRLTFIKTETAILRPQSDYGILIVANVKIVAEYLRLIVFPFWLHMTRVMPRKVAFDETALVAFIVIAMLVFLIFRVRKRRPDIFFWSLWFFIFLIPNLNIIQLNALLAEHWIYGASLGAYAVLALYLQEMVAKDGLARKLAYAAFVIIVVYLSSLTIIRNLDWKDEPSIYLNTLKYTNSGKVYSNLGVYYDKNKMYDKAIGVYKRALEISPNTGLYHNNIALVYAKSDNFTQAVYHWKKSLALDPDQPEVQNFLAIYDRPEYLNRK